MAVADIAVNKGLVGGPFGSSLVGKDYVPAGVPVIRGANLATEGRFNDNEFVFVSPEKVERDLNRNLALPGDVIFTQRGTLGQVGIVPSSKFERYVVSQSQMRLRVDRQIALPEFIYYYFRSSAAIAMIKNHAITTGVPHINLGILGSMRIPLPPLNVQQGICDVLGALDDQIAANQRVSRTAAAFALAQGQRMLLESRGDEAVLAEHAEIVKGVSYRSADLETGENALVNLKCVGRDGTFQSAGLKRYSGPHKDSQVVKHGDIVVAQTDLTQRAEVIGRPVRVLPLGFSGRLVASLDLVIVRPRPSLSRETLFALLSTQDFRDHAISYCNGTTVLHMGARALPEYRFRMPSEEAVQAATNIMSPLLDRSDSSRRQTQLLGQLRDALLPELMSGVIRVRDAAKVVEDAT